MLERQQADAVELSLEDPVRGLKALARQRRGHRLEPLWEAFVHGRAQTMRAVVSTTARTSTAKSSSLMFSGGAKYTTSERLERSGRTKAPRAAKSSDAGALPGSSSTAATAPLT